MFLTVNSSVFAREVVDVGEVCINKNETFIPSPAIKSNLVFVRLLLFVHNKGNSSPHLLCRPPPLSRCPRLLLHPFRRCFCPISVLSSLSHTATPATPQGWFSLARFCWRHQTTQFCVKSGLAAVSSCLSSVRGAGWLVGPLLYLLTCTILVLWPLPGTMLMGLAP